MIDFSVVVGVMVVVPVESNFPVVEEVDSVLVKELTVSLTLSTTESDEMEVEDGGLTVVVAVVVSMLSLVVFGANVVVGVVEVRSADVSVVKG